MLWTASAWQEGTVKKKMRRITGTRHSANCFALFLEFLCESVGVRCTTAPCGYSVFLLEAQPDLECTISFIFCFSEG